MIVSQRLKTLLVRVPLRLRAEMSDVLLPLGAAGRKGYAGLPVVRVLLFVISAGRIDPVAHGMAIALTASVLAFILRAPSLAWFEVPSL